MLTLLDRGKIIESKWMSALEKKESIKYNGIDFLVKYILNRVYIDKSTPPKIKIKGIGNKVLILRAATGSGKSALIAPTLYKVFFETSKKNIIITQPTRATATSIPYQIIKYNPKLKMGVNIGYQTGISTRKPVKGILFCTIGILLQYLLTLTDEQLMKKYSFILIDEVHNRSIETDLVIFYLKQFLLRNYENYQCPFLILMSGTFEPDVFMNYFECPASSFIDIEGLSFPIEDNFTKFNISNYTEYIIDLVEKIHITEIKDITSNNKFRDVLIFVHSTMHMLELEEKIHELNYTVMSKGLKKATLHMKQQQLKYITGGSKEDDAEYYLAPIPLSSIYISTGSKEYMSLYSDIESIIVPIYEFRDGKSTGKIIKKVHASRRVMIGTNAIETGITIDTLGYCIDSGWVKESQFNPNFGCRILIDKNVTKNSADQRKGRIGRQAPGKFYRCYTEESYNLLPKINFPEIIKEDITKFLLSTILEKTETSLDEIDKIDKLDEYCFQMNQFDQIWYKLNHKNKFEADLLDFIQYPSADSLQYSLEKLYVLGLIDNNYIPTLFGAYAAKFRKIRLECIRMIFAGYTYGVNILDLITISAFIEVGFELGIKKNKYTPRNPLGLNENEAFYYYKMIFADEFIEQLFIWNDFMGAIDNLGNMIEKNIKGKKDKIISTTKYLGDWCDKNGFKLSGFMKIIELRDEIISDMLILGLNPYYNGLGLDRGTYNLVNILRRNLSEGMEEIINIKKCIYDGFRMNLCIWNDYLNMYVCHYNNVGISIQSKLVKPITQSDEVKKQTNIIQNRPQKIILSDINLKSKFSDQGMYELTAEDVSVMDGFVDVDIEFSSH